MIILVKLPSRDRPQKLLDVTRLYMKYANNPQYIRFLISLDSDDPSVNETLVSSLKSIHPYVDVRIGQSKNKIDAINRDMEHAPPFDILLLASDDMIPIVRGYDQIIRENMNRYYPDTDGVLWFNDGYTADRLNTLVICGKKYYDRFGWIYNPLYKSFFCDNEFMETAQSLKRQTYFPNVIIKHIHPANTKDVKNDSLYIRNGKYYAEDSRTYHERKNYEYDVSLLICTLPERRSIYDRLIVELERQKKTTTLRVEILSDNRDRTVRVGKKRNDLVKRAKGKYCCFIDDDDMVSSDYISIYQKALSSGTNPDCVTLNGILYIRGKEERFFYHSMKYPNWTEDEKGYYRFPNHLNLMKTYIMEMIGFENKSYGEDFDFSVRLRQAGILQSEYEHSEIQYYYYYVPGISQVVPNAPSILSGANVPSGKGSIPIMNSRGRVWADTIVATNKYKASTGLKFII